MHQCTRHNTELLDDVEHKYCYCYYLCNNSHLYDDRMTHLYDDRMTHLYDDRMTRCK